MAMDIAVPDGCDYLEATYTAETITEADLAAQRDLVAEAVSRSARRKVLLDATAVSALPPVTVLLEHNKAVSANSLLQGVKYAVLFRSVDENVSFLENTGVNRSVTMKCFDSREAALSWLEE